MKKALNRTLAGIMSLLFVGQIMVFGDGASQGILHADTIAFAEAAMEEAKSEEQLAEEFDAASENLGQVEYFSTPNSADANIMTMSADDATSEEITFAEVLTVTSVIQKGSVPNYSGEVVDNTSIYVRFFDGNWSEIDSWEVAENEKFTVSASVSSDVYHVKFECDGYLPFYLKDFGTGSFQIGSGDSWDTITLIPGDTTWNEENENQWSDDVINGADPVYVQSCLGATRGDSDFNPTMDVDGDHVISQADLDTFCDFYTELEHNQEEITLSDLTMSLDINVDGVINDTDYNILADIVETGNNPNGYSLPELSGSDGYFTDADLTVFKSYLDDARTYRSEVYFYNHEMTGDIYVNAEDYSGGIDKINAVAQKHERSDNYYEYMDKNNSGTIEDSDAAWFTAAYAASGDLDWDHAFKRNLLVTGGSVFPYSLNLHDTNLDLNGQTVYVTDCMSFTTDIPQFWSGGQGATLDINGGELFIENNLVFRTASPDGWGGNTGQLMNIHGGLVAVGGDFNFGQANCYDIMQMTDTGGEIDIYGNWNYITLADMEGKWTEGTIYFEGPTWEVNEASGEKSVYSTGNHVISLYYPEGVQTILELSRKVQS